MRSSRSTLASWGRRSLPRPTHQQGVDEGTRTRPEASSLPLPRVTSPGEDRRRDDTRPWLTLEQPPASGANPAPTGAALGGPSLAPPCGGRNISTTHQDALLGGLRGQVDRLPLQSLQHAEHVDGQLAELHLRGHREASADLTRDRTSAGPSAGPGGPEKQGPEPGAASTRPSDLYPLIQRSLPNPPPSGRRPPGCCSCR